MMASRRARVGKIGNRVDIVDRVKAWWLIVTAALFALAAALAPVVPARAEANSRGDGPIDVRGELECLALTIYFEARGEPDIGKLAVAHVVMNRAQNSRYPARVCEVVRQGGEWPRNRCQFSWWCDGRSDKPKDWAAWEQSKAYARLVYWGFTKDPTYGALWYHADYVQPVWKKVLGPGPKIGRHIFYRAMSKPITVSIDIGPEKRPSLAGAFAP